MGKKADNNFKNVTLDELAQMMAKGFDNADGQFIKIDKRFDGVDKRFSGVRREMATKNNIKEVRGEISSLRDYTKGEFREVRGEISSLRDYTKSEFAAVRGEISELRGTVERLIIAVDGLAKAVNDLRVEHAALFTKIDRHERWIKTLAEKVGVELEA